MYTPEHLAQYKRPENYGGAHFPDYYTVYSVTRDSDTLARSNFRVIARALGFADASDVPNYDPRDDDSEPAPAVILTRAGHWACGWIDTLRIHTSAPEALLRAADEMIGALDDYPVADEDDFSDLEYDEASEYWAQASVSERVQILQRYAGSTGETPSSIFAARRAELPGDIDVAHLVN